MKKQQHTDNLILSEALMVGWWNLGVKTCGMKATFKSGVWYDKALMSCYVQSSVITHLSGRRTVRLTVRPSFIKK